MTDNGAEPGSVPAQTEPYAEPAIVGAGAWGTALGAIAARSGRTVRIWGRNPEVVAAINAANENPHYLPGVPLPTSLSASTDLRDTLARAGGVLVVTPSRTLREVCRRMRPHLSEGVPLLLCAKGIEQGSGLLLADVAAEELPGHPIGALSGPTFAREAALGHPTAATIAFRFAHRDRLAPAHSTAARFALTLNAPGFRPYVSDDLVGVEIGGAVKNVIAIACGMMTGAGFAENTRALLITRGMEEMKVLAEALGGKRETVSGLSGAGDLILTCSSETSRNMSLGVQLGRGLGREACFDGRAVVVEGEVNARSVVQLARLIGIDMPICKTVHAILHEGADMRAAFTELWSRPLRGEPTTLSIRLDHD